MSKGMYYRRFASGSTTGGTNNVMNLLKHFENSDDTSKDETQKIECAARKDAGVKKAPADDRSTGSIKLKSQVAENRKRAAPPPPTSTSSEKAAPVVSVKSADKKRAAPPPPAQLTREREVIIITKSNQEINSKSLNNDEKSAKGQLEGKTNSAVKIKVQQHLNGKENEQLNEFSPIDRNVPEQGSANYSLLRRPKSPYEEASTDFSGSESPTSNIEDCPNFNPASVKNNSEKLSPVSSISRSNSPVLPGLEGLSLSERKSQFERSRQLLEKTFQSNQPQPNQKNPPKNVELKRSPSAKVSDIHKQLEQNLIFKKVEDTLDSGTRSQTSKAAKDTKNTLLQSGNTSLSAKSTNTATEQTDDFQNSNILATPSVNGSCHDSDMESINSDDGINSYEFTDDNFNSAEYLDNADNDADSTIRSGYASKRTDQLGVSTSFVSFLASLDTTKPLDI